MRNEMIMRLLLQQEPGMALINLLNQSRPYDAKAAAFYKDQLRAWMDAKKRKIPPFNRANCIVLFFDLIY